MTRSASATLARYSSGRPTAFSKRESVGWEAKAGPLSGSRSSKSLWMGSSTSRALSLQSA